MRCACRHVADGAAPGDANVGEMNLVLDALVQRTIEVKLSTKESAEYIRVQSQAVMLYASANRDRVNLIEALRRPLSGAVSPTQSRICEIC